MQVVVTNTIGQQLKSFTLRKKVSGVNTETLDLTNFPKGVYMIRFGNSSQLWTEKLVIE